VSLIPITHCCFRYGTAFIEYTTASHDTVNLHSQLRLPLSHSFALEFRSQTNSRARSLHSFAPASCRPLRKAVASPSASIALPLAEWHSTPIEGQSRAIAHPQ
jgi:hypothetical protein